MRTKLTPEQITELHKYQTRKTFEFIRVGMVLGIIPWANKITISSRVRKLKTEI
jgi:hypothetical protein